MNRKLQNEAYERVVRMYAESIAVPRFDCRAIERRSPASRVRSVPPWRQYALATALCIVMIVWAMPAVPALIADVQNAVQIFLERDGQMVRATDRVVTIEEAMRDLPFRVIAPNGVPLAATPTIREISAAGDPASIQLFIQYPSNVAGPKPGMTALPALTIIETAATAARANVMVATHPAGQPPMANAGNPAGRPPAGAVRIRALTSTWVAGGTRVSLAGTPGAITQAQLDAIRRAMGGQ